MHHKHSFRRKLQTFFLSLLLVLLTVAGVPSAAYTAEAASADTTMAVHFLDVGQGLSILVQSQGQNLLYDGGDRGHSSFVVSYLQKQNISIIDYMISSHYDEDHVAGPERILLSEAENLRCFLLNRSAATITTILLRSGWKTEITIFFLLGMQNLPGRKRSVIWDLIFPAM